jgi:hypothetical protein
MNQLTDALHTFFLNLSHFFKPASDLQTTSQLKDIELTQHRILAILEDLKRDEVPRNANRIYKIGPARTTLFLNDLLPQVYLTLVSVLQGVALAVLIDQFRFDYVATRPTTYGYFLSSFLITVAFWHSYLNGIFVGRWPFRFIDTLLFFLAATAESIAFRHVAEPSFWCFSIGVMCLLVALIYFRQIPLMAELSTADVFEEPDESNHRNRSVRILGIFLLIGAGIAFIFSPITGANPQNIVAPWIAIALPVIYILYFLRGDAQSGVGAIG